MDRWTLVGRQEEQSHLAGVIADPQNAGVLVAGQAGVGKTRLLREVTESASDCQTEYVTATESARLLPFGALAHLLPENLRDVEQVDLLAVIGRHLLGRANGRRLVLNVDDVHLLDQFSAALVHHVATTRMATVLLTMRSGQIPPDAVTALHRDGIISRLELQPISRTEFNALLEAELGGPTETTTLDRLWETTQGNVFFTHELVTDAIENGTLHQEHGLWRWFSHIGLAPRIQEAVASRLGVLASSERRLLEFLAVGEPIPLESARRLCPDVSVSDLERRSVLVVEDGRSNNVRLAHPLFGEAIRADIPMSLLRQVNRDLADELSRWAIQGKDDSLRLVVLQEAAGDPVDPQLLVEAATRANQLSDHALAERLAHAAIGQEASFAASNELGIALLGQRRHNESEAVLRSLIGHEPDDIARARLGDMLTRSMHMDSARDRVQEMIEIFESVEQNITDPHLKALVQCDRAAILALTGRFAEAVEIGLMGLNSVEDEIVIVRAIAPVAVSLIMEGRMDEAIAMSQNALEISLRVQEGLPRAPAMVLFPLVTALFFSGRFEEALALTEVGLKSSQYVPTSVVADATAFQGRFQLSLGRPHTAARLLREANITLRHYADTVEPGWCLAVEAEAHALVGHLEHAATVMAEVASKRDSGYAIFQADRGRAVAWMDAQNGRMSAAIEKLWVVADLAATLGQRCVEVFILEDLLRLGESRAAERCLSVTALVDGDWSAAVNLHAIAVQSSKGSDYAAAAEAFGSMGCALNAAELWFTASTAYQQEGLQRRAAEAARRSSDLLSLCEGARTPVLSVSPSTQGVLTRRERETATLAASGATNGEIADQLSVSVRTVESHLYSVFAKLGITERAQLLDSMKAQPLPNPPVG